MKETEYIEIEMDITNKAKALNLELMETLEQIEVDYFNLQELELQEVE